VVLDAGQRGDYQRRESAVNTAPTHVSCEVCQMIRPLRIERSHEDDQSGQFTEASDLTCVTCGFVIATMYLAKAIDALRNGE
jgi:hypothetical protein